MSESWITQFLPPRAPNRPVSCAVCGCRLMAATPTDRSEWRHLPSLNPLQDARGCRPECVGDAHGIDGRVVGQVTAAAS